MLARLVAPLLATACIAATAQAARVALRIDPSLGADGRLAAAIAKAAGVDDWTREAVAADAIATRPADAGIVAIVTRVAIAGRPGVRIVAVDAGRGLRLDVDATALLDDPAQPTDAAGVADILGASVRRAIEKARQPVERLFIVPPASLPSLSGPTPDAERPVAGLPIEDAVVGAILARRGAFVREVEHRLALCPVPAIGDAPEVPATPTSLVAITLKQQARTDAGEPLPGTVWIRIESPDAAIHEQSTPVARSAELIPFTATLARAALADGEAPATRPATQPTTDRLSALVTYRNSEPRPSVVAALLELAVADAPGDVERRRALVAAYAEATRAPNGMTPAMTPVGAEREDVERWPVVRDLDRRAALRRRALAHAWQAMGTLPRIPTRAANADRRDPLVAILAPLARPEPYVSNVYGAMQRRLAESDAADAELFARWADERRRTGHFDDGLFVALGLARRPMDQQAEAALAYLQASVDRPGLIERAIDLTTPFDGGTRDGRPGGPPIDGTLRAMTAIVGPARVRQASYAATMRRGETWTEEDRRRLMFGGLPQVGVSPDRPAASTRPSGWKAVDDVPWTPAIGDDAGGLAYYANRLVVRAGDAADRTILDVHGPAGEAGHIFYAAFDGRFGYASIFRPWMPEDAPTIYVFDPRTGAGRFLGEADGVPPCDADRVAFAPLGPGRLFVAGGTTSTWMGTITFDGTMAATDVIARTKPLPVRPRPAMRSATRAATRPVSRPTTTTAPTTAEAIDATQGFTPTEAWPVGGGGPPTHVLVARIDVVARATPLLVSLTERSVTALPTPVVPFMPTFRYGDTLYRFRPPPTTSRPATQPRPIPGPTTAATGPATRPASFWIVERFDAEAAQFVPAGRAVGFAMRGQTVAIHTEGGRIYVADASGVYAAPSPTGPYEPIAALPPVSRFPLSGSARLRLIRAEPLTIWTSAATYRLDPTTRPAADGPTP